LMSWLWMLCCARKATVLRCTLRWNEFWRSDEGCEIAMRRPGLLRMDEEYECAVSLSFR
jgi:hypothetical protein